MRRTLESLHAKGTLERKGQGRYYFVDARLAVSKTKEILLIMRCNPNGDFNCLGERELSFMRKV